MSWISTTSPPTPWSSTMNAKRSAHTVAAVLSLDLQAAGRPAGHHRGLVWLRLNVLIQSARLDRPLAEGRSPATDPRLALRPRSSLDLLCAPGSPRPCTTRSIAATRPHSRCGDDHR